MRKTPLFALVTLTAAIVLVAGCSTGHTRPSLEVSEQALQDSTVTIDTVATDEPGWLVIHADQDGSPGPVIGHTGVDRGRATDVTVEVDEARATDTVYAMLHRDTGTEGEYEFPDADPPLEFEGEIMVQSFRLTG